MRRIFKKYIFLSSHVDKVEAVANQKIAAVMDEFPQQELEFEFSDFVFRIDSLIVNQFIVVYQITE